MRSGRPRGPGRVFPKGGGPRPPHFLRLSRAPGAGQTSKTHPKNPARLPSGAQLFVLGLLSAHLFISRTTNRARTSHMQCCTHDFLTPESVFAIVVHLFSLRVRPVSGLVFLIMRVVRQTLCCNLGADRPVDSTEIANFASGPNLISNPTKLNGPTY